MRSRPLESTPEAWALPSMASTIPHHFDMKSLQRAHFDRTPTGPRQLGQRATRREVHRAVFGGPRAALLCALGALVVVSSGCQQAEDSPQAFASSPQTRVTVRPAPIAVVQPQKKAGAVAKAPVKRADGLPHRGNCAVTQRDLKMFWKDCDPDVDCFVSHENGKPEVFLRLPARGPMVLEAHLMTDMDDLNGYWPSSGRHGIKEHYKHTEAATGYVMKRRQPWAPAGEGGCQYGQGSAVNAVPVDAEAWYVNMFWRRRPAPGTRMILRNPVNGRTVVAAAGYETGPGSNTAIGGASEETHHYLGTGHRQDMVIGFAQDQTLPFGPIICDP